MSEWEMTEWATCRRCLQVRIGETVKDYLTAQIEGKQKAEYG